MVRSARARERFEERRHRGAALVVDRRPAHGVLDRAGPRAADLDAEDKEALGDRARAGVDGVALERRLVGT